MKASLDPFVASFAIGVVATAFATIAGCQEAPAPGTAPKDIGRLEPVGPCLASTRTREKAGECEVSRMTITGQRPSSCTPFGSMSP